MIFEILLNIHTAYYSKGEFISDKRKILIHYFKKSFFLDLMIEISFALESLIEGNFMFIFLLVKIIKIAQSISKVI